MLINDYFWLSIASVLFLALAFKPAKKYIYNLLDSQIDEIKNNLKEAEKLYIDAQNELLQLKSQYKNTIDNKEIIIQKANSDAHSIISEAKDKSIEFIERCDRVAKERMVVLEKEFINNTKKLILEEALKNIKNDMKKKDLKSENDMLISKKLIDL